MRNINILVVGATGKVGEETLAILAHKGYTAQQVCAVASAKSAGKRIPYARTHLVVQEMSESIYEWADVAFISANNQISESVGSRCAERGVLVIDDSSVFRLHPNVPLVVPEVNPEAVDQHKNIISIPNCSVTPLVMLLKPLSSLAKITALTMTTYQAVSGAGQLATAEMYTQARDILFKSTDGDSPQLKVEHHPRQIAFNVIPQIGDFDDIGYTSEEMKTYHETRKIMRDDKLRISATCVRVPVDTGHSGAVTIEFAEGVTPEQARVALRKFGGVEVLDEPSSNYPTPLDATGRQEVLVGRIRKDLAHSNSIVLWFSCDNLLKGAAWNAVQILDSVIERNRLPSQLV